MANKHNGNDNPKRKAATPHERSGPKSHYLPVHPTTLVRAMTMLGATHEEIAKVMGVKANQFRIWQRQLPELEASLKKGKHQADLRVINSLFCRALAGDVTACIFWLKNRIPGDWRDRREQVIEGNIAVEERPLKDVPTDKLVSALMALSPGGQRNGGNNGEDLAAKETQDYVAPPSRA
jgi:hypothetical protein